MSEIDNVDGVEVLDDLITDFYGQGWDSGVYYRSTEKGIIKVIAPIDRFQYSDSVLKSVLGKVNHEAYKSSDSWGAPLGRP